MKKSVFTCLFIATCAAVYAVGTSLFIFPARIVLGGTGGLSVLICRWLPLSAGAVSTVLNIGLIAVGFIVLGKNMGAYNLWGAFITAMFIYIVEVAFDGGAHFEISSVASAIIGGTLVASATGMLFALGSSSGGTDIVALIVNKRTGVGVGGGLLIADFITVAVGSMIEPRIALASLLGFAIKVIGADIVVRFINGKQKNKTKNLHKARVKRKDCLKCN